LGIQSICAGRLREALGFQEKHHMFDALFVAIGVVSFALTVLYIVACEHM
jgi:hypothetical protein